MSEGVDVMADIEHWTDVSVLEPASDQPLDRIALEIALSCRMGPWVTGRPAATYFERFLERPKSAVTEIP
jgi:hypothetical protein